MVKTLLITIFIICGFNSFNALAENTESNTCWPQFTSVNAFVSPNHVGGIDMITENLQGYIVAPIKTFLKEDSLGNLNIILKFDEDQPRSLPYNLMSVMVLQHGKVLANYDYTFGCLDRSGVGLFPNGGHNILKVKKPRDPNAYIQILIWGWH